MESKNNMTNKTYTIHTSSLKQARRKNKEDEIIEKNSNEINITFCKDDKFEKFEEQINLLAGSSFIYKIKKRFSSSFVSIISVLVIMFALIASSIYEDLFKKLIFELPFSWNFQDTISLIFVFVLFFGILIMPSLLDTEGNEFKNSLSNWFNKDARKIKRLSLSLSLFDKSSIVNLYNIDLFNQEHWTFKLLVKSLVNRFDTINFHIRNDQVISLKKELKNFNLIAINTIKNSTKNSEFDIRFLLSNKEDSLYSLMQLSSSIIVNKKEDKNLISLELFEYLGKNYLLNEIDSKEQLLSSHQNFVFRSFNDFDFIFQDKPSQICLTNSLKASDFEEKQKKLSYYLRNHIEECVLYFDDPISLLILYYYVKDIVIDKKRSLAILEKFISSIVKKQQYNLVDEYWFEIAGEMFDSSSFNSFEENSNSIYRELSLKALNDLVFLFERNASFSQSLLLNEYLYEINPIKYSINISSLHERMGSFDKAYETLPKVINNTKKKPSEIEVRFYQRKAWIIVSQRKEEFKKEGLENLNILKELLFSHNEDNEAVSLWHYYNIKANYDEWEEDYNQAIINYKKCLNIPNLGSYEYGASFVNMAISYRFNYLKSLQEFKEDVNLINEAIKLGSIGISLKQEVGDRDEIPLVLHNQALNILSKMVYSQIKEKECLDIINITQQAIDILKDTNSSKKFAMLLIENIIAKALLKKDYKEVEKELRNYIITLNKNEFTQISNIYKECIKTKKIETIKDIENFKFV